MGDLINVLACLRSSVGLSLILVLLFMTGCASPIARSVSAPTLPGAPVITFPNSFDAQWNTGILSQPNATQAGVDGRALTISIMHGTYITQNNLMLDFDGNLGIRGVFKSVSTRKAKTNIHPYRDDAIKTLRSVPISTFAYRGEAASEPRHIGFIAENAPVELSGPRHDSFNLNNSVGLTMAAAQQLDVRVERLQHRVNELEHLVTLLCRKRGEPCSK